MTADTPADRSAFESTEAGRDVHIGEEARELYDQLTEQEDSPFYKSQRKDLFMLALGYGRNKAGRTPLEGDTHALFNRSSLTDQQEWIIKAVALKEERDPDVLRDEKHVYHIAEEYANGGIRELHSLYVKPGDTLSDLSTEIIKLGSDHCDQIEI